MRRSCLAVALMIGCSSLRGDGALDPYDVEIGPYDVTIRRTSHGIPHIRALDLPSLFFGTGYAFATDHVCTLADQIVKVRSERSKYLGRGAGDANLHSDIAWTALRVMKDARERWFDLDEDIRNGLVAYAAGYNRYLEEVGPSGLPTPCRDAEWVRPITHIDLLAYYLHLGQMGSGFYLLDYIATASPPGDAQTRVGSPPSLEEFGQRLIPRNGSNAIALGGDRTETGRGMVVSNSHFEGEGERRWWEFHQTVPGELDVYGVGLMGVPLINMGFNEHVAWTHTVSTTPRFVIYALDLQPGNPTRYRYDGEWRDMTTEVITIGVLGENGEMTAHEHTLYRSHYGPMLQAPLVGWTGLIAFTYRDVNASNLGMIPTWWQMNRARSVHDLAEAQENQGIPWVHTVAADADGLAFYGDTAAAPYLSEDAEVAFEDFLKGSFIARQFRDQGAYVLDGGDPVFEWVDAGTALVGAMPMQLHPTLFTRTYAVNSNENHWLANVEEPLESFPLVFGPERSERQGRTKITARLAQGDLPSSPAGEDGKYSHEELQAAILTFSGHYADILVPQLVERCQGANTVPVRWRAELIEVELQEACDVLAAWDRSYRASSRGAHVFREWIGSGDFKLGRLSPFGTTDDFSQQGAVFADAFDPANPIQTPSVMKPAPESGPDPILVALAKAVLRLNDVGIALDAQLGDIQYRLKAGQKTACPGGKELEGSFMIADWRASNSTLVEREHDPRGEWVNRATELTADGYPVNGGDSWIATIAFTDSGPEAAGILVYSQSADPDSPYFNDQADLHAQERLRPIHFRDSDIHADPNLSEIVLTLP